MSLYIFVRFFIVYRILVQKYENNLCYRIWFTVFAQYNRIKDVCFFLFSDAEKLFSDAKYFSNAYLQPCKYLIHSVLKSFAEGQKFVRGTDRELHFYKETNKICKNALFFRIFSIFAFRCMIKLPLIGAEIAPPDCY